jgi:hypothetical protein
MLHLTQLTGFGVRTTAATAALTTLSFQTSGTSAATVGGSGTSQLTAPAGINAGDLLVLHNKAEFTSGTGSNNIPSGFTSIGSLGITGAVTIGENVSYKIANGTESGSTLSGISASNIVYRMALGVFRGNIAVSSVSVASFNSQLTSGAVTNQTVTSSGGTPPLIVFAAYGDAASGNSISPRGFSPAADGEITADSDTQYLDYKIYNSSPSNHTISMDDEGVANMMISFYLSCT